MQALRPTYPTKTNDPTDPDNIRKFQSGDANNIKSVLDDHADHIDTLLVALGINLGTNSIGIFVSLAVLQAAYPEGANGSYAIIDDGLGGTPAVATYNGTTSQWEISPPTESIIWVTNVASLPGTGVSQKIYVALDSGALYYWHSGSWQIAGGTSEQVVRYIENNGVQYRTEKGYGNSGSNFEAEDVIESWYDSNKNRFLRAVVLTPPLTLPEDFDSEKVFVVNQKIKV